MAVRHLKREQRRPAIEGHVDEPVLRGPVDTDLLRAGGELPAAQRVADSPSSLPRRLMTMSVDRRLHEGFGRSAMVVDPDLRATLPDALTRGRRRKRFLRAPW